MLAKCKYCQQDFSITRTGKIFCSRRCYLAYRTAEAAKGNRKTYKKQCPQCGRIFFTLQHNRKLCSKACTNKWQLGKSPANKLPIPDEDKLKTFYIDENLSTNAIGKIFNVSGGVVAKWLKFHGIPLRTAGIGLSNRGIEPPTAEELYRFVHEQFLTYEEIAKMYDVDFTAIPVWLDKYAIPRSNRTILHSWVDRANASLEEMIELYDSGWSLAAIGQKYGVSRGAVALFFKDHQVSIRRDGWQGKRFECEDGHIVRSTYEMKVDNWLYQNQVDHAYEPRIPETSYYKADFFANGWYIEIWGVQLDQSYQERKRRKLHLYQKKGLPLIQIPAHAFASSHNGLWERKLRQCLEVPTLPEYPVK